MLLAGPGCDPEGRELVVRTRARGDTGLLPVCAVMCRNAWRLGMLEQDRGSVGLRIVRITAP